MDGYRMMARIDGRDIRLVSRNGVDWTTSSQVQHVEHVIHEQVGVAAPATQFREPGGTVPSTVISPSRMVCLVLTELLQGCEHPAPVQRVEHFEGDGNLVFAMVVELGLQGSYPSVVTGPTVWARTAIG